MQQNTAWAPEGREWRSQAGRRAKRVAEGHQLEIGAQRAPRFLVYHNYQKMMSDMSIRIIINITIKISTVNGMLGSGQIGKWGAGQDPKPDPAIIIKNMMFISTPLVSEEPGHFYASRISSLKLPNNHWPLNLHIIVIGKWNVTSTKHSMFTEKSV